MLYVCLNTTFSFEELEILLKVKRSAADFKNSMQFLFTTSNCVSFNVVISASKNKCAATSKPRIRCKLAVDGAIIQQEVKFQYLGKEISGYGDVEDEVRQQTARACFSHTIWRNKHMDVGAK